MTGIYCFSSNNNARIRIHIQQNKNATCLRNSKLYRQTSTTSSVYIHQITPCHLFFLFWHFFTSFLSILTSSINNLQVHISTFFRFRVIFYHLLFVHPTLYTSSGFNDRGFRWFNYNMQSRHTKVRQFLNVCHIIAILHRCLFYDKPGGSLSYQRTLSSHCLQLNYYFLYVMR